MSFLKGWIDTLDSIFSGSSCSSSSLESHQNPRDPAMDRVGVAAGNERIAGKLKGYFDLAKEEVAKAVRAEEWGLVDDAISHYKNSQRMLTEATSTSVPSYISSSEHEKVKSYRQKMLKWQSQVPDRLQTLNRRAGSKFSPCFTSFQEILLEE